MYVHIHIARMCICSISLIWSAFPTEHLFYILDKLIIITLSNFTLSKFFSPASSAIKFLFFRLILMDLPTVFWQFLDSVMWESNQHEKGFVV